MYNSYADVLESYTIAEEGILSKVKDAGKFMWRKLKDMIDFLIGKVRELTAKLKGNGKRMSRKELMEKIKEQEAQLKENDEDFIRDYNREKSLKAERDKYKSERDKYKKERDDFEEERDAYKRERNKYYEEGVKSKMALAKLEIERDKYKKDSEMNQKLYEIENSENIAKNAAALKDLQISGQMAIQINVINNYIVKIGPQIKDMEKALLNTDIDYEDYDFLRNKYRKRFSEIDNMFDEDIIDKLNKLYDSVDKNSERSSYFHISLSLSIRKCLKNLDYILTAFKTFIKKLEEIQNRNINFGKELTEMQNYYAKLINGHLNSCNTVVSVLKRIGSSPRIIWID